MLRARQRKKKRDADNEGAFRLPARRTPIARNTLIEPHLDLARSVARRFEGHGVPCEDLEQEALLGLMRAGDLYAEEEGVLFSSYAQWWMRKFVLRAIEEMGRSVRVPTRQHDKRSVISRAERELEARLKGERKPTVEEIAQVADLAPKAVLDAGSVFAARTVSLDARIDIDARTDEPSFGGDSGLFHHIVEDEEALRPEDVVVVKKRCERTRRRVAEILRMLPSCCPEVHHLERFLARYGFRDGAFEAASSARAGTALGVSRNAVDQVVNGVWERLRAAGVDGDCAQFRRDVLELSMISEYFGLSMKALAA
ncbi:MAG: sigma-70 family RNA polymerase sigma factor [Patescibacteria group bacterium]